MKDYKVYVIYYKVNGAPFGYEVYGVKQLKESVKWLHSIKASSISIYKRGRNFETNQDDVMECYKQYWK